ncbi:MAG: hypothetical protein WB444_06070, partial [Gallionella sp.]
MNIAVQGLFATPVAALEVPGSEGRNAGLSAIILKKRETTPSVQASNAGGWHSDRDIAVWGGPHAGFILDPANGIAHAYGGKARTEQDYALKPLHHVWEQGMAYALLG